MRRHLVHGVTTIDDCDTPIVIGQVESLPRAFDGSAAPASLDHDQRLCRQSRRAAHVEAPIALCGARQTRGRVDARRMLLFETARSGAARASEPLALRCGRCIVRHRAAPLDQDNAAASPARRGASCRRRSASAARSRGHDIRRYQANVDLRKLLQRVDAMAFALRRRAARGRSRLTRLGVDILKGPAFAAPTSIPSRRRRQERNDLRPLLCASTGRPRLIALNGPSQELATGKPVVVVAEAGEALTGGQLRLSVLGPDRADRSNDLLPAAADSAGKAGLFLSDVRPLSEALAPPIVVLRCPMKLRKDDLRDLRALGIAEIQGIAPPRKQHFSVSLGVGEAEAADGLA